MDSVLTRIPPLTHDLDHVGLEVEGLTVISYAKDNNSSPT